MTRKKIIFEINLIFFSSPFENVYLSNVFVVMFMAFKPTQVYIKYTAQTTKNPWTTRLEMCFIFFIGTYSYKCRPL